MVRAIEFRSKRQDNGEWVYGDLVHLGYGNYYIGKIKEAVGRNVQFIGDLCDPATVGEFTGERTADGTKIFEGDILETENIEPDYKGERFAGVVIKLAGDWAVSDETHEHGFFSLYYLRECGSDRKIIGTIYDKKQHQQV